MKQTEITTTSLKVYQVFLHVHFFSLFLGLELYITVLKGYSWCIQGTILADRDRTRVGREHGKRPTLCTNDLAPYLSIFSI